MSKLYPITVSHKDGSFAATPEATIEAGLLNGMIEPQRWSLTTLRENIAWDTVTDRFVKGSTVRTGQRVLVMWDGLPMAAEDVLTDWVTEEVAV
jgi:hypothetical protein